MTARDRPLGLYSATTLVVASMIGAGLFTTSGFALADLGSRWYVLAAWFIAGAVALTGAACYGALSQAICESGGEYVFLSRTVHPLAGFLAGWISLLAGFTGAIAFAAAGLEAYCRPILPESWPVPAGAIASAAILFCVGLHAFRVELGAGFQNVVVTTKLIAILVFISLATWLLVTNSTSREPVDAVVPWSALAFANTLTWISLSYSGFNAAVYVADEVREPRRTVPRSMLLGTALVAVIYVTVNAFVLWSGPAERLSGETDVVAKAAQLLGGTSFATATRALIVMSLATSVSALIMSGPRVYAKMSADGLFPLPLPQSDRAMTTAVIVQGVLAIVAVYLATLRDLLDYLGFTLSLSAAVTVATIFLLARRPQFTFERPLGYPATPIFFVFASVLFATMTAVRKPWTCGAVGAATLLSGVLIYMWLRHRRQAPSGE